jgi:outer membrane protein assembly factor BamB
MNMSSRSSTLSLAAILAISWAGFLSVRPLLADAKGAGSPGKPDANLIPVSSPASPKVAYGLSLKKGNLEVLVSVASFESQTKESTIGLQLGLAVDKTVILSEKDAKLKTSGNTTVFEFLVPEKQLITDKQSWDKLRMAITVTWPGGPFGEPSQRETFLQTAARATHTGLSPSTQDWQPVNPEEFERTMADRQLQIAFDFAQPMDGKATIVIEDEQGRRLRNLISGREMSAGNHRIVWDGADDNGNLAPPGKYQWRALSHPGLKPQYLFSFCDAPGSNHGTFHAATSNGRHIFLGTSVSEGGHEISQLEPDGRLVRGYIAPNGHGLKRVALAADDQYLYAAYDGAGWDQKVDRSKPNWSADNKITLARFDLSTGMITDYSKTERMAPIRTYQVGPGSPDKAVDKVAMAGLALVKGRLYMGDQSKNEILEIDPATGAVARTFPLENPVALAAGTDTLYALAGQRLVELNPVDGQVIREIATLDGHPAGLAVGPGGMFYVSDDQKDVVHILNANGKKSGQIGKDGGLTQGTEEVKAGPYDPLRLMNPAGLVLGPDGHLWVTESNRWQPKRFAAYDPKTGAMWKEFFGPVSYGASNCGFDPEDSSRWIGQGTLFKLDFEKKTSTPISILGGEEGRTYRFWRQDGRTFVIACGKVTYIEELLPDNSLKPLAFLTSAGMYAVAHKGKTPPEFVEAFNEAFNKAYPDPKNQAPATKYESGLPLPRQRFGMLWVDQNGDGKMQKEEIEFSTAAEGLAGSYWSHDFQDLTLRVPGAVAGKMVLAVLKPDGWWPGGAPKYPPLNEAVKAAIPIDLPLGSTGIESTVDRFGNTLLNSSPMRAFSPEGRLLWTYPNRWNGVHGSHEAPLPTAGELQGVLFFTGIAPLDDKSDVTLMNGNHGRAFVMTTDGLYVDEMFPDVRLMRNPQAGGIGILGGECFGGTFGRSKSDGNYYFQGGGLDYRIYRVDGLREIVRSNGSFVVTPEQAVAAERNKTRVLAAGAPAREAKIAFAMTPPVPNPKATDESLSPVADWNPSGQFPVAVKAAHDGKTLTLSYVVKDASPWVNNGKDWQQLFKTGDSVDLQLGTDPAANPGRTGPVPGDLRLLIAPFQGDNIAVLYRHRLPGAKDSVVFQSPWRSEKVDSVKKLDGVKITVTRSAGSYTVKAEIPMSDLGLNDSALAKPLPCDFGVIYGDAEGTTNIYRNYWSNQATGLVNDVPGEIMLTPNLWGKATLEKAP